MVDRSLGPGFFLYKQFHSLSIGVAVALKILEANNLYILHYYLGGRHIVEVKDGKSYQSSALISPAYGLSLMIGLETNIFDDVGFDNVLRCAAETSKS